MPPPLTNATDRWSSRRGFILATAGSAVGLGNIWRFPSVAADNGGGAFLLLYIVIVLAVAVPAMMAEILLGRHTGRNPVDAFLAIRPGSPWALVGGLGVVSALVILSYYSVIAGWVLAYTVRAAAGGLVGLDAPALGTVFAAVSAQPLPAVAWHGLFMLLTAAVVAGGVQRGIERWSRVLMPGLAMALVLLAVWVVTLPGAGPGVAWFLQPRWEGITWATVLRATGQAFFSVSLGMGPLITYGSYLAPRERLHTSALYVAAADTAMAILAGLVVIPTLFAFGYPVQGGPGLLFVTLPGLLDRLPLGRLVTTLFFAMVAVAALTSAISLLEVVVAFVTQRRPWSRPAVTAGAAGLIFLVGIPSALSQSQLGQGLFGIDVLALADGLASNLLLPVGGLLTTLFVGWVWGVPRALAALHPDESSGLTGRCWGFSVRLLIPVALALMLVQGLLGGGG